MSELKKIQNFTFVALFLVSVLGVILSLLEGESEMVLSHVTIIFLTIGYALEVNTE